MKPIKISITGEIDLHNFKLAESALVLAEYFNECIQKNIFSVKVIHGKGKDILKKSVIIFFYSISGKKL